jgi:hypothetical protein
LQDPTKFTQIRIFGLKINHLATLLGNAAKRSPNLLSEKLLQQSRVTRLGAFSPFGRNFAIWVNFRHFGRFYTLSNFLNYTSRYVAQIFRLHFRAKSMCVLNLTNYRFGLRFGRFFQNVGRLFRKSTLIAAIAKMLMKNWLCG